jgi:SagB-type dehydrogenase family enzyme
MRKGVIEMEISLRECLRALLISMLLIGGTGGWATPGRGAGAPDDSLALPTPHTKGGMSVEEALSRRRSVRRFDPAPLSMEQLSQLFWALQGITSPRGFRTAPSAGATFPLEVYAATRDGLYHYIPEGHRARILSKKDLRPALGKASLGQPYVSNCSAVFVITADFKRTSGKYGSRTERYVTLEAGHAAQNLMLQAVSLDLGTVAIGAFVDEDVHRALGLPAAETPLYLICAGRTR